MTAELWSSRLLRRRRDACSEMAGALSGNVLERFWKHCVMKTYPNVRPSFRRNRHRMCKRHFVLSSAFVLEHSCVLSCNETEGIVWS